MKRELIDQCVYTRGIHQLEYPEMRKMIRCAFGTLENVCCIFVHKMTAIDIRDGYMVSVENSNILKINNVFYFVHFYQFCVVKFVKFFSNR